MELSGGIESLGEDVDRREGSLMGRTALEARKGAQAGDPVPERCMREAAAVGEEERGSAGI